MEVHNVYFMKKDFTEREAEEYIKSNGYKLKHKDIYHQHHPTEWRYNQIPKTKFKSFVTKILPNKVHIIFGIK